MDPCERFCSMHGGGLVLRVEQAEARKHTPAYLALAVVEGDVSVRSLRDGRDFCGRPATLWVRRFLWGVAMRCGTGRCDCFREQAVRASVFVSGGVCPRRLLRTPSNPKTRRSERPTSRTKYRLAAWLRVWRSRHSEDDSLVGVSNR